MPFVENDLKNEISQKIESNDTFPEEVLIEMMRISLEILKLIDYYDISFFKIKPQNILLRENNPLFVVDIWNYLTSDP